MKTKAKYELQFMGNIKISFIRNEINLRSMFSYCKCM